MSTGFLLFAIAFPKSGKSFTPFIQRRQWKEGPFQFREKKDGVSEVDVSAVCFASANSRGSIVVRKKKKMFLLSTRVLSPERRSRLWKVFSTTESVRKGFSTTEGEDT